MQCEDNKYLPPKFSHSLKDLAQLFHIQEVPPADDMSIQSELSQYSSVRCSVLMCRSRNYKEVCSPSRVCLLMTITFLRLDLSGLKRESRNRLHLGTICRVRVLTLGQVEGKWKQREEVADLIELFLKPEDPQMWDTRKSQSVNLEMEGRNWECSIQRKNKTRLNRSTLTSLLNRWLLCIAIMLSQLLLILRV